MKTKQSRFFMGIDTGTHETRGVLMDGGGKILCFASVPHEIENPQENYFECDANKVMWEDLCTVSRRLLSKSGVAGEQVAALGISVMGPDVICVDENCNPLRKAILYGIDARVTKEIEALNGHYGEERAKELYGHVICSDDGAPKILWIKNHEPEVYEKTFKFLTGTSFTCAKLTGNYYIDKFLARADYKPLYDDQARISEECRLYCRPDQLAPAAWAHCCAGCVTPEAAALTGLSVHTRVTVGSGDSAAEAISCGITEPGAMMLQLGSTMYIYYCADRYIVSEKIHGGSFVVPDTYKVSAGTNAAGLLTRFVRDSLFEDYREAEEMGGVNAYEAMARAAAQIGPGSNGLLMLPYIAGERDPVQDPKALGMLLGLRLGHRREDIYHAALEAVAFSAKQIINVIEEHGLKVQKLFVSGGGTKNSLWMQILSDVLGKRLFTCAAGGGSAFGDGLLAMLCAGAIPGYENVERYIRVDRVYEPDVRANEVYGRYFSLYDRLYESNAALMHKLADIK